MASGASTVPEQMAASLLGVRCLAFATVSNPASGTIENYVHD
jgi:purine nucleoside phosphorylase